MNHIKAWKENWLPWCKVGAEMKEIAEKIEKKYFRYWDSTNAFFGLPASDKNFANGNVFQLPENFQCPHGETKTFHPACVNEMKVCQWCGEEIIEKPKMGWGAYPIKLLTNNRKRACYMFEREDAYAYTSDAPDIKGFGGIKYKAPAGYPFTAETMFCMSPPAADEKLGPYVPIAVRFWEEVTP